MKTLGQMDLVIGFLKRLEEYVPERKYVEQTRFDEVGEFSTRMVALFNNNPDPLPVSTQMAASGAAEGRQVETCEKLIIRVLADAGVTVVPKEFDRWMKPLSEHLAYILFRPIIPTTPGMGLEKWIGGDDKGSSSLFIASVLAPPEVEVPRRAERLRGKDRPLDSSDFGRCQRLLQVMPEWRGQLGRVGEAGGPAWHLLVMHWDELSALYAEGKGAELHTRIQELEKVARASTPYL